MSEAVCIVSGHSDDLIEVDGVISEEFTPAYGADANTIVAFSTGVVLRVRYTDSGVWRISPVTGADRVTIEPAPEDDESNYSDRATLTERPTWVVFGTVFTKAASDVRT